MLTFNKHIQIKVALNPDRAYLGKAPSLNNIRKAYNIDVLIVWIIAQLEDVNDFVGVRQKMTLPQMEHLACIIISEYGYLKATELHLFLYRLKAGRYGVFYGCIDPLIITRSLTQFMQQRGVEIAAIENKSEQQRLNDKRKQWATTAVSRHQYELLKTNKNETRK